MPDIESHHWVPLLFAVGFICVFFTSIWSYTRSFRGFFWHLSLLAPALMVVSFFMPQLAVQWFLTAYLLLGGVLFFKNRGFRDLSAFFTNTFKGFNAAGKLEKALFVFPLK